MPAETRREAATHAREEAEEQLEISQRELDAAEEEEKEETAEQAEIDAAFGNQSAIGDGVTGAAAPAPEPAAEEEPEEPEEPEAPAAVISLDAVDSGVPVEENWEYILQKRGSRDPTERASVSEEDVAWAQAERKHAQEVRNAEAAAQAVVLQNERFAELLASTAAAQERVVGEHPFRIAVASCSASNQTY